MAPLGCIGGVGRDHRERNRLTDTIIDVVDQISG
jgi:hypothetical protein